jgi:hypothetical protein
LENQYLKFAYKNNPKNIVVVKSEISLQNS